MYWVVIGAMAVLQWWMTDVANATCMRMGIVKSLKCALEKWGRERMRGESEGGLMRSLSHSDELRMSADEGSADIATSGFGLGSDVRLRVELLWRWGGFGLRSSLTLFLSACLGCRFRGGGSGWGFLSCRCLGGFGGGSGSLRSSRSRLFYVTGTSDQGSNLRTGHLVIGGEAAVNTLAGDTGVRILVGPREGYELASLGDAILVTTDLDLRARRVELGFGSQVQSNDFMTEEVVSRSQVRGEGERNGGAVHDVLLEPLTFALLASFMDLEPFSISGIELVT